jgi:hypothetical protein
MGIAVGRARHVCFLFLVAFCGVQVMPEAMRQAIATLDNSVIRDASHRLDRRKRNATRTFLFLPTMAWPMRFA